MSENMSVEEAAINAVIQYELERLSLNSDKDIRVVKMNGYDVVSADGRTIEVKGTNGSSLSKGLILNSKQEFDHLKNGGYLYRVVNCKSNPEVHVFQFDELTVREEYRANVTINKRN